MGIEGRRRLSPGSALVALGLGHAVWGVVAYGEPLREIVRAGVFRAVGDGVFDTEHADGARAAGFWFMFVAPLVSGFGYLTEVALRNGDARSVRVAGGTTLALGAMGTAVMPRSGFPAAVPLGVWLLRRARALDT